MGETCQPIRAPAVREVDERKHARHGTRYLPALDVSCVRSGAPIGSAVTLLKLSSIKRDSIDTMEFKELRNVPGHPGYQISSEGMVYGKKGKLLKLFPGKSGYLRFTTIESGRWQQVSVHVMVCMAFHGPRPKGAHAAHADGNILNNSAANLSWKSAQENEADKVLHDRRAWGVRHGMHKLTESEVREIRKSTELLRVLAERYSVSETNISYIRNRKSWRHIL